MLKAPDFAEPCRFQVDVSDVGIGAVVLQEGDQGIDHPIYYFSYKFKLTTLLLRKEHWLFLALRLFDVYLGATIAPLKYTQMLNKNTPGLKK